jgi:hypothetical protein
MAKFKIGDLVELNLMGSTHDAEVISAGVTSWGTTSYDVKILATGQMTVALEYDMKYKTPPSLPKGNTYTNINIGDEVLIPWESDPTGFLEAEVIKECGNDSWGTPLYTVKPIGHDYLITFAETELFRISNKQKPKSKCECGAHCIDGYMEIGAHSTWCPLFVSREAQ